MFAGVSVGSAFAKRAGRFMVRMPEPETLGEARISTVYQLGAILPHVKHFIQREKSPRPAVKIGLRSILFARAMCGVTLVKRKRKSLLR